MLEPVSVGLKFGFLAVLYLFLMWVAWSALRDLRRGRNGPSAQPERPQYDDATGMYPAAAGLRDVDGAGGNRDEGAGYGAGCDGHRAPF